MPSGFHSSVPSAQARVWALTRPSAIHSRICSLVIAPSSFWSAPMILYIIHCRAWNESTTGGNSDYLNLELGFYFWFVQDDQSPDAEGKRQETTATAARQYASHACDNGQGIALQSHHFDRTEKHTAIIGRADETHRSPQWSLHVLHHG